MITIDANNNIRISHGDTLTIEFFSDYSLKPGDRAVLGIKGKGESSPYACCDCGRPTLQAELSEDREGRLLYVIAAKDMQQLQPGEYEYDLSIHFYDGRVNTVTARNKLLIEEVAHL